MFFRLSIVDEALTGNEERDTDLVCKWIAVSYGQFDENYHAAYSREIIRQSRHAWGEIKKNKDPVWF